MSILVRIGRRLAGPLLLLGLLGLWMGTGQTLPALQAEGIPALAGRVVNPQGQPIHQARVTVYVCEGEFYTEAETQDDGIFVVDLPLEMVDLVRVEVHHPHFHPISWQANRADLEQFNDGAAIRLPDITMEWRLTASFWIATAVFLGMLLLVATERLHSTMAALLGVAIVLGVSLVGGSVDEGFYVFGFEQAIEYVDFDVIFLVMGMMIVIGVIEETGIFQWMSYQAYRLSGGRIWLLAVFLMLLTAVASALLDNVTTMLLVAPISLQIALTLGLDPLSLLLPEVLASNVGGTSTLIGTPTNILIGSYAGIGFNGFVSNLTLGVVLVQLALTLYVLWFYRHEYRAASKGASETLLARLAENARITQPAKLRKAGVVFIAVILLFVVGERFHLVPAVTAILGAVTMLLVVRADIQAMLKVVDWTTLMFFIALFIVVGAIQEVGLISYIASFLGSLVGESLIAAILVTLWASAFLSTVVASIPFTAAMLPVVGFLSGVVPGAHSRVLFYALSVGASLGGNGSLIGSSSNLVTAGIAERAGYPISYKAFLKVGLPALLVTTAVGTLWLFIRF